MLIFVSIVIPQSSGVCLIEEGTVRYKKFNPQTILPCSLKLIMITDTTNAKQINLNNF